MYWRNLFRSVQAHSGMYLAAAEQRQNQSELTARESTAIKSAGIARAAIEPVSLSTGIFLLPRTQTGMPEQERLAGLCMRTTHADYVAYGYAPERRVTVDEVGSTVTIADCWHHKWGDSKPAAKQVSSKQEQQPVYACFQFILHPDVTLTQIERQSGSAWLIQSSGVTLELSSDELVYEIHPAWYSPEYGVKVVTQKLYASRELTGMEQEFLTQLRVI
jgi:uncharacterized heparinase superfamily protein